MLENIFSPMSGNVNSGQIVSKSSFDDSGFDLFDHVNSSVSNWLSKSNPKDLGELLSSDPSKLPASLQDLFWQYQLNEKSLNSAFQRELWADSTKYQRMVEDLKKAGINPMFALGGASAGNINSQSASYSSSQETARYHKASEKLGYDQLKETKRKNNMDFISSIMRLAVSAIGLAFI